MPSSSCRYHVKSYEECRAKHVSIVEPNGPCPSGSGLIGQIEHPRATQINCYCKYGFAAELDNLCKGDPVTYVNNLEDSEHTP